MLFRSTGTDFLTALYRNLAREQGLEPVVPDLPEGVRAVKRVGANGRAYRFVMNYLPREARVSVGPAQWELLTGQTVSGDVTLPPRGVLVLTDPKEARG